MAYLISLLAILISVAILLPEKPIIKIIIAVFVVAAPLVIMYPSCYLSLFLILRPALDLAAKQPILGQMNIAAISTIVLIVLTLIILVRKQVITCAQQNQFLMQTNKLFLCFLVAITFSFINTKSFLTSFADYLRLLSVIVFFNYAFLFFSGKDNFKKLFLLIAIGAILPLLMGAYQYLGGYGNEETLGFNRIYGTFLHPNVFGQYLVVIFLAVLYFLSTYKSGKMLKIALYCGLSFILFELYHTYSRGSWITLFFAGMLFSLNYKMTKKIALYILLAIILIVLFPAIQERFWDILHSSPYETDAWHWRIAAWQSTKSGIMEHPIIGSGLGTYEQSFTFMAHNDYLRVTYETGFLGLLSYLLFLGYLLFKAVKANWAAQEFAVRARYTTAVCLLASLLIMSLADNLIRSTVVLLYLFGLLGALLGRDWLPK